MRFFVFAICFVAGVFYPRSFISGLIEYRLNKNARRKRKKGQSFLDWLLYRRYYDIIPKALLFSYYSIPFFYCILLIILILFEFFQNALMAHVVIGISALPIMITDVLTTIIGSGYGSVTETAYYEYFFDSKGRQKKRHKLPARPDKYYWSLIHMVLVEGGFVVGFFITMPK